MRILSIAAIFVVSFLQSFAQPDIDSLRQLIARGKEDTNRVLNLGILAYKYFYNYPDSTYYFGYKGIKLAQELHYKKGESLNLLMMGKGLYQTGNYPAALDALLKYLKINEEIKNQRGIMIAWSELATFYSIEKEYKNAVEYGLKSLQIAQNTKDDFMAVNILGTLGSTYEDMGELDSALYYLNRSNETAIKIKAYRDIAFTQVNLAAGYIKLRMDKVALEYYRLAMPKILVSNVSEALCEMTLYMAGIFQRMNRADSALGYAKQSLALAVTGHFTQRQLSASDFLASFYEGNHNTDSAFRYLKLTIALKDSISNQERMKTIENLTFDETIRQQEIAAQKKSEEENHVRNLQLLAIGVFIPIFFLCVLFLSRTKVKPRIVEFLGLLSLLLFFEFITDLVYPYVSQLTNENPIWEMLFLVILAALLEPLNFKLEHWVKRHLVHKPVHIPILVMVESISNDTQSQEE